jgi:SagB-type dehydrogenase family enzyme
VVELAAFKPALKAGFDEVALDPAYAYAVAGGPVSLDQLARVLFAAQGCTARTWGRCLRAAPSAGATYPLQAYAIVRDVEGLEPGFYRYVSPAPFSHRLELVSTGTWEGSGAFAVVLAEVPERTTSVYGERGYMYVREEVGHASQGALLEAGALGLAAEVGEAPPGLGVRAEVKVEVGRRGARGLAREIPEGELPRPPKPKMTLEEAIVARRSVRDYSGEPVELAEVAGLLAWTLGGRLRSYPPLRGSYRVSCYVVARNVEGLKPGVYEYLPLSNSLERISAGDYARRLAYACLGQEWVARAALNVVLCARESSEIAEVEAGMVGQGLYLAATSLGLGTVAVGAFYDDEVASVLGVSERPLYVFPVGRV